jgi:hypothetical protein
MLDVDGWSHRIGAGWTCKSGASLLSAKTAHPPLRYPRAVIGRRLHSGMLMTGNCVAHCWMNKRALHYCAQQLCCVACTTGEDRGGPEEALQRRCSVVGPKL